MNRQMTIRALGLLTLVIGAIALLRYPIHPPEMVGRPERPRVPPGNVVFPSLTVGPILVTLGVFVLRKRTLQPLTIKRAFVAPLLAIIAGGIGLARYLYLWEKVTPFQEHQPTHPGNFRTVDLSVIELLHRAIHASYFVAIVVLGGFIAGVAFASRGFRAAMLAGLGSIIVLVSIILAPISIDPSTIHAPYIAIVSSIIFLASSFILGCLATAPSSEF